MLVHLVASASDPQFPLADPTSARWLWLRLRRAFSHALATCLMPQHVHIVTPALGARAAAARLGQALSGHSRHLGSTHIWQPVPPARIIPNDDHLLRALRYVHLNPCREKECVCSDPLEWPYSTHRGVIGAEIDPWVSAERLGAWFGRHPANVPAWFHAYVSGDPSVAVAGTPLPRPAQPCTLQRHPLADIVVAAEAATPWSSLPERRQVFVWLAYSCGWTNAVENARALGVHPHTIRRLARNAPNPAHLAPALLCLGDARLRAR